MPVNGKFNFIQGSYSVLNTWKSMELNFLFFKVMNSMKFRVPVPYGKGWIWGSFVEFFFGGAKLLFASIFFMKFDEKFSFILLKLIEI